MNPLLLSRPGRSRLPLILQSEGAECGLACLAMVAGYHGHEIDLGSLRRRFSLSMKGATLRHIMELATCLNLAPRPLRVDLEGLAELETPCILHWNMNHFVVLKRMQGGTAIIHDPAAGECRYSLAELSPHFTGVALELTPTTSFTRRRERSALSLPSVWGRVPGLGRALGQALLLSLLLQLVMLASPFYMQLAVDEAVQRGDEGLLFALALGFGFLALIQVATTLLRSLILANLNAGLGYRLSANLFHHLIRLPLPWFEKRQIGDIISRFGSLEPIKKLIAEGVIAALVDGAMAMLTLVMAFVYSPLLASIVLAGFCLLAVVRLASFQPLRRRQEEVIQAASQEQTIFIETARSVQSLKLFARENDRERVWLNRLASTVRRAVAVARLHAGVEAVDGLIRAAENLLVVYLGAGAVIAGDLSVGMLYAFVAYKQSFVDKATILLNKGIEWRMLDLHLDRIGDIALEPREPGAGHAGLVDRSLAGAMELCDVFFRYSDGEPWTLHGVSLAIAEGEFVALTGRSGCGKTTLMKLMLALMEPQQGEIRIDGVPLSIFGVQNFRRSVGVVMQDDQLLSGSIADNICFFDPHPDLDLMRQCARTAEIEEDILAMPMDYNTLVGDMGAALSGGQRQRILLARALYRRPRILFMDEGTSHLDLPCERRINAALARLRITRIVVAHRPDTIQAADRVIRLEGGRIVDAPAGDRLRPATHAL